MQQDNIAAAPLVIPPHVLELAGRAHWGPAETSSLVVALDDAFCAGFMSLSAEQVSRLCRGIDLYLPGRALAGAVQMRTGTAPRCLVDNLKAE